MKSRRHFLQHVSSAAILAALRADAWALTPSVRPAGNGQVNLNSFNPTSYGLDFPFIDCGKMMTPWILFGSDVKTDIFTHLNADGFPTGFPAGGTGWRSQTKGYLTASDPTSGNWILDWDGVATISANIGGGSGYPGIKATVVRTTSNSVKYNVTAINPTDVTFMASCVPSGNSTVITVSGSKAGTVWTGQRISGSGIPPDATLGGQISGSSGGDGTYAVNSLATPFSAANATITLHAFDLGQPFGVFTQVTSVTVAPTRIRFYRADEATLLGAGQITAPHFIDFYQKYGCLRFMDWQNTNGSLTAQWINRSKKTNYSWLGGVLTAYCGICTQATGTNDYTAPRTIVGNPESWADGMLVQACFPSMPTAVTITNISVSRGTVTVTAPNHRFSNGQHVFFPTDGGISSSGWGDAIATAVQWHDGIPLAPDFTVTVLDSNQFTLTGVDGSRWKTYRGGGTVAAVVRLATASLPLKRVINKDGIALYQQTLQQLTSGTNFTGMGTPWSFVYNEAMDALLIDRGPANENGTMLGVPIEVITQLCNECNVPPWICFPVNVTDDFVLQTATYLRRNLNSNLRVRIEFSNELWNLSFPQWNYTTIQGGLQLGIKNSAGDYSFNFSAGCQWVGYRFYKAMAEVNTAYSGAMNQMYRILAINGNAPDATYIKWIFEAPKSGLAPAKPHERADAFAIAPYFEPDRTQYPTAQAIYQFKIGDKASAFDAADKWFNTHATDGVCSIWDWQNRIAPFFAGVASTYKLEMHQYEGGWGVYPNLDRQPTSYNPGTGASNLTRADVVAFWQGYKASSNWGAQYAKALATYKSNGGKFASNYWLTSSEWNFNNMFGAYGPNIAGVPTPYYVPSQPTPELVAFDAYNNS
jgi:hypothetical protein